jgi:hypothetical protein
VTWPWCATCVLCISACRRQGGWAALGVLWLLGAVFCYTGGGVGKEGLPPEPLPLLCVVQLCSAFSALKSVGTVVLPLLHEMVKDNKWF